MAHRLRFGRDDAIGEELDLAARSGVEVHREAGFDGVYGRKWGPRSACGLRQGIARGLNRCQSGGAIADLVLELTGLAARAGCRAGPGEGHRALEQIALDDRIDDALFVRARGCDKTAFCAHFQSEGRAAEAGQSLRPASTGDDAEQHFRLSDLRAGDGHAIMAGHCELEPAAERGPVNRRDERFADVLDGLQPRVHDVRSLDRLLACFQLFEDVDIRAGNERRSSTDHHDSVGRRVVPRALDGVANAFGHPGTQRVDGRIVDSDDGDAIANFVSNQL